MEEISIYLLVFIFIFLIYSYMKYKKEIFIKIKTEYKNNSKKKDDGLEKHVIAAVIASLMDGKEYKIRKIRKIFLEKETNKKEAWKISGRHYNTQRRERV